MLFQATLGHPYDDANEAPYFGFNEEILEVQRGDDETNYCYSEYTSKWWCTYENTDPDGTSAYLRNVDGYYEGHATKYNELHKETITIKIANGMTWWFMVIHYFQREDYHPDEEKWNKDHTMVPALTIINPTTGDVVVSGLSHPVHDNVSTHINHGNGTFGINPEYEANFKVGVTCDNKCKCVAHKYTVF